MSGKEFEFEVTDLGFGGKGVGRHDGIVCFVDGVLPGELVRARIIKKKKKYIVAKALEILRKSDLRIEPQCQFALFVGDAKKRKNCQGCKYQHLDYKDEVFYKNKQLGDLLERMAGVSIDIVQKPLGSPKDLGYRNKIVLHAGAYKDESFLGYYAEDNRSVIPIASCPLACNEINNTLSKLKADSELMESFDLRPGTKLALRYTESDGVVAWTKRKGLGDQILTEETEYGTYKVPYDSFFQINNAQRDNLVAEVMKLLKEKPTGCVYDLFCGVGVFAVSAAKNGTKCVVGSDIDVKAIAAAEENALNNNVEGVKFKALPALDAVLEFGEILDSDDTTLIVDPPRTGLGKELIDIIAKLNPVRIIYVSCAPDTLARDLKYLSKSTKFKPISVKLIDMFPRTAHFESVNCLER